MLAEGANASTKGPWAQGRATFKAFVIVNESAGSVGKGASAKVLEELEELGGQPAKVVSDIAQLTKEDAAGVDLIVVLGGDGTARAAAEVFASGPPLVLLPGGTLNMLPHALYGELPWSEALRAAITRGRVAYLTGGIANGRKFFVAAVFGAPTLLARAREAARLRRFDVMLSRLHLTVSRLCARRLAVRPDSGSASRAEAVAVLCPAYEGEVRAEKLEWVRLDAKNIVDLLRVGLRSVIGGWREDSQVETTFGASGEIRSPGIIPAILDGEPVTFLSRVRVRTLPSAAKVIVV